MASGYPRGVTARGAYKAPNNTEYTQHCSYCSAFIMQSGTQTGLQAASAQMPVEAAEKSAVLSSSKACVRTQIHDENSISIVIN